MTDNEFMARLADAGRSRLAGEVRAAGEIYAEMDAFLRLGGYQNRLRRQRVTKVFGGVRAESVLRYLFDRVSWCMDACEAKRACTYIRYYKSIEHDFSLRGPLDVEMSMNEIEVRLFAETPQLELRIIGAVGQIETPGLVKWSFASFKQTYMCRNNNNRRVVRSFLGY